MSANFHDLDMLNVLPVGLVDVGGVGDFGLQARNRIKDPHLGSLYYQIKCILQLSSPEPVDADEKLNLQLKIALRDHDVANTWASWRRQGYLDSVFLREAVEDFLGTP